MSSVHSFNFNGSVVEVEVVNESLTTENDVKVTGALVQSLSIDNPIQEQVDEDGLVWFNAKDVCRCLGYNTSNINKHLTKHTDKKDRGVRPTLTRGGFQTLNFINESGLYSLILGSELPKAKEFKHWITSDVLPSIRKTGRYSVNASASIKVSEVEDASRAFKAIFSIMETIGCSVNESALTAANEARSLTGYDVVKLLPQSFLTVAEEEVKQPISYFFNGSKTLAAKANKILASLGYIEKLNESWIPTEKGREFGVVQITSKPNGMSRTVITCHYPQKIVSIIGNLDK